MFEKIQLLTLADATLAGISNFFQLKYHQFPTHRMPIGLVLAGITEICHLVRKMTSSFLCNTLGWFTRADGGVAIGHCNVAAL